MRNNITTASTRFRWFIPFSWKTMRDRLERQGSVIHNLRASLQEAQIKVDDAMLETQIACDSLENERQAHERTANELRITSGKAAHLQKQNRCLKASIASLAAGDYEQVYECIRDELDPEGWTLYRAAQAYTGVNPSQVFHTEDNLGYFEELDGHGLIYWVELSAFGECKYRQLNGGYELSEERIIHKETEEYQQYRKAICKEAANTLLGLGK